MCEFQRTLPEYTRLDLKRSVLGIGILNFAEYRDWFKENVAERERERERERELSLIHI